MASLLGPCGRASTPGGPQCHIHCVYTLGPAMPVLLRPDGAVQIGWDPRRALVRPPHVRNGKPRVIGQ
ncbi:hypothetical protein MCEMAEM6B_00294 [Mycobacteriaceae bacterium]